MKILSSVCKLELQYLSTLYTKTAHPASSKIFRKYVSSKSNTPRNMFELYAKNSHWLGVYQRHPLKKEPLTHQYIEETLEKENQKNILLDLESIIDHKNAVWTPESKRVGAIGVKLGCTSMWTKEGFRHAVTLIQIKDCHVMDTQISREDGGNDTKTKLILGALELTDEKKIATFSHEKMEWFHDRGLFPKQFWSGFEVTKDALLLPGTEITASHFMPGQFVNVAGITVKKGFQGVMKRWGMKGQPASHGQSKTHRKMGATGGGQDPGRIFPGKRMAGHVGGKWRVTKPLKVFRVDTKLNVVFVKGHVPGERYGFVLLNDCGHRKFPSEPPPFPTHFKNENELDEDMYADYVARFTDPSLEFPPYKI